MLMVVMKYIYHYVEQRIYNSNNINSSIDCTTICITLTRINIQNTHFKQTKFWRQENLDAI